MKLTFGRVIPNAGYEARFRRDMKRLVKAMHKDVRAEMNKHYSEFAKDAAPVTLTTVMAKLRKKWYGIFNRRAKEMATWLVETIGKRTQASVMEQLRKIGFALPPNYSRDQQKLIKELAEQSTSLIKSIPQTYLRDVQEAVREAVEGGGDMKELKERIKEMLTLPEEKAERRAELIAKDQINKVTQNMALESAKGIGATKGEWIHVPGEFSSRITHIEMDGKEFDLSVGMYDEDVGKNVMPGELPYCMCQFQAIFPGIE